MSNQTTNMTEFWVYRDTEGNPAGFNEYWRTRTEPVYDARKKNFVISDEGKSQGDFPVHLNVGIRGFLPPDFLPQIKEGVKAHVILTGNYEIKNKNEPVEDPLAKRVRKGTPCNFQLMECHDRLIFGRNGRAELYERQGLLVYNNPSDPVRFKEEYVDASGMVIERGDDGSVYDHYIMIGRVGSNIIPHDIGKLWCSDVGFKYSVDHLLVDAYRLGLRFEEPPEDDDIEFLAVVKPNGVVTLRCQSYYYGFSDAMDFNYIRVYKPDEAGGFRSLEKTIINGIVGYRWFFNRPNLLPRITVFHGDLYDNRKAWKLKSDFEAHRLRVDKFETQHLPKLMELLSLSIEVKWHKRQCSSHCFDPAKMLMY